MELESRCQSTSCVGESSNVHNLLQPHPEGLIYLIGGYDGTSWLAGLDSYSPSNDKLIPLKPMSTPRSYACATALDGDIYVIGGGINGDTWFNTGIIAFFYQLIFCYDVKFYLSKALTCYFLCC